MSTNRLAMCEGVHAGLRRAGTQALVSHAIQLDRNVAAEMRLLQSLALALLVFAPHVTLGMADGATVLLEMEASLRLFGGHRALYRAVRYCAFRLGAIPQLGTKPTARGAARLASAQPAPIRGRCRAAARQERVRRAVRQERLSTLLDQLPVDAVARLTRPDWLGGFGCCTLSDLRELLRSGLWRCCRPLLMDTLDTAYGNRHESFTWFTVLLCFDVPLESSGRIGNVEGVLTTAEQLLLQLIGWLSALQLGVKTYRLALEHECRRDRSSEDAASSTPVGITLTQPVHTLAYSSRVLHERVHRLALITPVVGLRLTMTDATPLAPPTESLFPEPGDHAEDAACPIDTLIARLGAGNVLHPQPCTNHRPERANHWVKVNAATTAQGRAAAHQALAQQHAQQPERLLWLLKKPIALLTRQHYPYYRGRLWLVSMSECIESGWWDDVLIKRDYFIAEGEKGERYWVCREHVSVSKVNAGDEDAR